MGRQSSLSICSLFSIEAEVLITLLKETVCLSHGGYYWWTDKGFHSVYWEAWKTHSCIHTHHFSDIYRLHNISIINYCLLSKLASFSKLHQNTLEVK